MTISSRFDRLNTTMNALTLKAQLSAGNAVMDQNNPPTEKPKSKVSTKARLAFFALAVALFVIGATLDANAENHQGPGILFDVLAALCAIVALGGGQSGRVNWIGRYQSDFSKNYFWYNSDGTLK